MVTNTVAHGVPPHSGLGKLWVLVKGHWQYEQTSSCETKAEPRVHTDRHGGHHWPLDDPEQFVMHVHVPAPAQVTHTATAWTFKSFSFCVYFCLLGPFDCISYHKFSRQLSISWLFFRLLISALLVLSTAYFFMKVSLSPDTIPSSWVGSKHQLTN